jgi:hypothetical protein
VPQTAIFGPVFAMVGLTLAVWVTLFARRVPFLQRSGVDAQELIVPGKLAEISPPEVAAPSDNLKNLFELPVLFYVLALYLFATQQVDGIHVALAWVFAAFRALHSLVHCTINRVMLRFSLYFVAALALWALAGRAAWQHVSG